MKIKAGMKLLKCFKYFFGNDYWELRRAQDAASRVIQEKKVEGYLYLSVHPLDYLTISENNNKWRSCHALDGDYRAGNLNYMVDDTTIVAYLASDRQEQLKCMPDGLLWNSKKWRMLLHTNHFNGVIYYNRQYPFSSSALVSKVYWLTNQLYGNYNRRYYPPETVGFNTVKLGRNHEDEYKLNHSYFLAKPGMLVDMDSIVDYSDNLGYCDLLYSEHYLPMASSTAPAMNYRYTYDKRDAKALFHDVYDIKIGKKCKCVKCNKGYMEQSESFLCDNCIIDEDADEGEELPDRRLFRS